MPGTGALSFAGGTFFISEDGQPYKRIVKTIQDATGLPTNSIPRWVGNTPPELAATFLTVPDAQTIVYPANARQTFAPGNVAAGLNVGAISPDPSTLLNGDIWYNSATNQLMARINGVSVALGPQPGIGRALPPRTDTIPALAPSSIMHDYLIPINTLMNDGDYLEIVQSGVLETNNNLKGFIIATSFMETVRINSLTGMQNMQDVPASYKASWDAFSQLFRLGPTQALMRTSIVVGRNQFNSAGAYQSNGNLVGAQNTTSLTIGIDFSTQPFSVRAFGIVATDNDISQNITAIKVFNF